MARSEPPDELVDRLATELATDDEYGDDDEYAELFMTWRQYAAWFLKKAHDAGLIVYRDELRAIGYCSICGNDMPAVEVHNATVDLWDAHCRVCGTEMEVAHYERLRR